MKFKKMKNFIPWLIAIGIFAYLFHAYSPSKILEAMTYINIIPFLASAIIYFVVLYIIDTWTIDKTFAMLSKPVGYRDTLVARGVTYLMMIINYPASQAAFAYYMKRRHNIPIFEALGVFLIIVFVDFMWVCSLAFVGSFFQDYYIGAINLAETTRIVAVIAYIAAFSWIFFWRTIAPRIHKGEIPFISRLLRKKAFSVFMKARPFDYIKIAIWRIPIHFMIIIFMYVVVQTFGTHLPFLKVLGNMPLVFFVGTIPITPGGLGTSNAALVELLSPYLTGSILSKVSAKQLLFAVSLIWVFTNYLLKAILGSILLKKESKELFKEIEVPEAVAEEEATHIEGNL